MTYPCFQYFCLLLVQIQIPVLDLIFYFALEAGLLLSGHFLMLVSMLVLDLVPALALGQVL